MAGTARVFGGTSGSPIAVAGDNVLIYGATAFIQGVQIHDGLEGGTVGARVNSSGHLVVHQANDGTVSVTGTPNVHVTNAATVTLTGTNPVTILNNGTVSVSNLGKAEDDAHSSGDTGVMALGVRKNEPSALAGADGDYQPPIYASTGAQWVHVNAGTIVANAGSNLNTSALALESGGNLASAATSLGVIDDWDESDRAKVNPIAGQAGVAAGAGAVGATTQRVTLASDDPAVASLGVLDNVVYSEDAGHSTGDPGIATLGVRKNEPAALAGADADYTPLTSDAVGALWTHTNDGTVALKGNVLIGNNGTVSVSSISAGDNNIGNVDIVTLPGGITGFAEDAGHSSGDVGIPAMAVRKNEPAALAGSDADYTPLTSDALGAAWTHVNDGTVAIKGNVLVGNNGTVTLTGTNPVFVTNNGTVSVSNLRVLEDDVANSGDAGIQALAVRRDAPTSGAAAGDYHSLEVDDHGGLWTNTVPSGTVIQSSVAGTVTFGTILTASNARLGYSVHNDSDNILYLRHGDGAASTAYHVRMVSQAHYEIPFRYTGLVTGVWSANGGSAHVGDFRAV